MWQCSYMLLYIVTSNTLFNYSTDFVRWQVRMRRIRKELLVFYSILNTNLYDKHKTQYFWKVKKKLELLTYCDKMWNLLTIIDADSSWKKASIDKNAALSQMHDDSIYISKLCILDTCSLVVRGKPLNDTHFMICLSIMANLCSEIGILVKGSEMVTETSRALLTFD